MLGNYTKPLAPMHLVLILCQNIILNAPYVCYKNQKKNIYYKLKNQVCIFIFMYINFFGNRKYSLVKLDEKMPDLHKNFQPANFCRELV